MIDAKARAQDLKARLAALLERTHAAMEVGGAPDVIAQAERKAGELREEYEALVEWARCVNGLAWDRSKVARHLINLAWKAGDMAGVLEVADALPGQEPPAGQRARVATA